MGWDFDTLPQILSSANMVNYIGLPPFLHFSLYFYFNPPPPREIWAFCVVYAEVELLGLRIILP